MGRKAIGKNKYVRIALLILIWLLEINGVILTDYFSELPVPGSLLIAGLAVALAALSVFFLRYAKKRCQMAGLGFGFFFGLFLVIGKCVREELWDVRYGKQVLSELFLCFLGTGCILGQLFSIFYQFLENMENRSYENKVGKHYGFFRIYVVMLLCYALCFLAYFPGCMSYDSWYITLEALGIIGFDNHHPFLHTLVWSLFAHMDEWLGIDQIGIMLYTLTQLLIMAAIYSYAAVWIFKRKGNRQGKWLAFLYYAANPVFHIFSLLLTKDVFFSGCFLLMNIVLFDFLDSMLRGKNNKEQQKKIVFLTLLCCLLRNNMIYVILVLLVILLFVFKKRILQFKGLFISVVLYYFVVNVVYPGMGVAGGSIKEMLSVPLSQIAAVCQSHGEDLSMEDKKLIIKYIPDVESYDRFFADYIKTNFNAQEFKENKSEFLSLWLRLFWEYPSEYVKAFLSLNLPYWYPEMESVREYIETDNYSQDYPVKRLNLLPAVYGWYEEVSENQAGWMHFFGFKQLYSIGMPIWILLFYEIWFLVKKRKAAYLAMLPGILLWMTYLLGPVSSFRYIEPLMLTYPIWFELGLEGGRIK